MSTEIDRALDRYRRSIAMREQTAIRATLRAYREAIAAVDSRITQLRMQLEAKPEAARRSYALAQQEGLRADLERELLTASRASASAIEAQRGAAIAEASATTINATRDVLIAAGHAQVATALGGVVNAESVKAMVAQAAKSTAVHDMLTRHAVAGANKAADRLVRAVATGENPRKIAAAIRQSLGNEAYQALRIARTEIIRAHTAGSLATMMQTRAITPRYQWTAGPGACIACLAQHGEISDVEVMPDRHPNCTCVMMPVVVDPTTGEALDVSSETGQDIVDNMSDREAAERFGTRRGAMLKAPDASRVPVKDMLTVRQSDIWGGSSQVTPLKDLVG